MKLLRFLQDRQFFRVGSTQVRSVDVRFVCATNRDLTAAVRERSLREDFYYRINVFPIQVPSLRERVDDIPLLAQAYLRRRGATLGLADEVVVALQQYPWPGNVRELENVLERALILAMGTGDDHPGGQIQTRHLPPHFLSTAPRISAGSVLAPGFSIDRFERELIREALARTVGNKTEAAKLLGITRRRLYSRLKSIEADEAAEAAGASTTSNSAVSIPPRDSDP